MDAARFVAAFVGYSGAEPIAGASGAPQLKTADGVLEGLGPVARYIVSHGAKPLAAESPETDAQVDEWLAWASTELSPLVDAKLFKVNDHLQARTFIVGSSLTLADLVVAGVVQPAVVAFPVAQTLHFCNLLRWYDFIQHLAGPASTVLPKQLVLTKPKFQPPAPLPPPAPKVDTKAAAAAAAGDKRAGGEKKAGDAKPAAAGKTKADGQPAAVAAAAAPALAPGAAGAPANAAGDAKAEGAKGEKKGDKAEGGKAEKKGDKGKGGGGGGGKKEEEPAHIGQLDIRVGTIVKVGQHPNADALYLEEIDIGEEKPRQIISGLVKFVPVEKMQGRRVLVVCNLKPAKMRDVMSYGMVLCASNDTHDQVDPIIPPEGVPNGEAVSFEGFEGPPMEEVNPKKKLLEKLFPDMVTDAAGVPNFKGSKFMTSKGPVTSTIPNAHVA